MTTAVALALTTAVTGACSSGSETPETFDVTGSVEINGHLSIDYLSCGKLRRGDQIRIENGDGSLLGVGELGRPEIDGIATEAVVTPTPCSFPFSIREIASGEKFYEVTVADNKIGTYTEDEIRQPLTLS